MRRHHFIYLLFVSIVFSCSSSDSGRKFSGELLPIVQPLNFSPEELLRPENFRFQFSDTIAIGSDYDTIGYLLNQMEYSYLFNTEIRELHEFTERHYLHSLIKNTPEEKMLTVISWHDGGAEYIQLLTVRKDTTIIEIVAQLGNENRTFSVVKNTVLTRFATYLPMATEWIDDNILNVGFFWDHKELTITKFQLQPRWKQIDSTFEAHLTKLELYHLDPLDLRTQQDFDEINRSLVGFHFESYEELLPVGKEAVYELIERYLGRQ